MKWLAQIQSKQLNPSQISEFIDDLRQQGQRIVFTNGCFDILHKGHVTYLAKAAEKGDALIVGINSDQSVKNQGKGDDRPINDLEARMTLLAGLGFVAAVVPFEGQTPIDLIEKIQPDVLVKGADYDPQETNPANKKYIVGREIVLKKGGSVEVIELVDGFSTTSLINKMKK